MDPLKPGRFAMKYLALLPLLGLVLAPTLKADDEDKALEKLQGSWKVVKYVNDGNDETPKEDAAETWTVKGNHYELTRPDGTYRGDLKLDSSSKPGKIEATLFDTKDKKLGETFGIFKLDGDELTVCWNEDSKQRPDDFTSKAGTKDRLIVLKKK